MIISIVNRSNGLLLDSDVQRVIRAVNRQVTEDVFPYWHRKATLRLEGTLDREAINDGAGELRGQAIIYICETVDQEDYIGFHDVNLRGVPFGFVFLDICACLDEEWSVTLSHEALEMLMDPEVNLLAKGPHPSEPWREVFHWYELCDAVQDESYEIDGVSVSNFLLPLYFTTHEEEGGRNDFLGTVNPDSSSLASFGVNPGGYVGFFDPLAQDHQTFTAAGDARAQQRMQVKGRAQRTRRAHRYRAALGQVSSLAPRAEDQALRFSCFVLEVSGKPQYALTNARAIVDKVLGDGWTVKQFGVKGENDFEVYEKNPAVTEAEAWDLGYRLAEEDGVESVETMTQGCLDDWSEQQESARRAARRGAGGSSDDHLPGTENCEWSLEQIKAKQAWTLFAGNGKKEGEGVRIGHPDTGFRQHPAIWAADAPNRRIDTSADRDFVDGDNDAIDELVSGPLKNPGHGTGTASVIMSGKDRVDPNQFVTGVAPFAELVPFRVSDSVVLFSDMRNLAKAIYASVEQGCHVVSISMGGLRSRKVRKAVRHACVNGAIVLAASGNRVRFVVWPARFEEVIAVAATNIQRGIWSGSSRGSAVDISAPGESVWRADGETDSDVGRGRGTSHAAAATAGVASLWLSFHGVETLKRKYGADSIPILFRDLLIQTANRPPGWDTSRFGAGIVDAHALLQHPLPDRPPGRKNRTAMAPRDDGVAIDTSEVASLFEGMEIENVRRGLGNLLHVQPAHVDETLAVVGDELMTRLLLSPAAREAFAQLALDSHVSGGADGTRRGRARLSGEAAISVFKQVGISKRLTGYLGS